MSIRIEIYFSNSLNSERHYCFNIPGLQSPPLELSYNLPLVFVFMSFTGGGSQQTRHICFVLASDWTVIYCCAASSAARAVIKFHQFTYLFIFHNKYKQAVKNLPLRSLTFSVLHLSFIESHESLIPCLEKRNRVLNIHSDSWLNWNLIVNNGAQSGQMMN